MTPACPLTVTKARAERMETILFIGFIGGLVAGEL
jgi:hypothetical protein